MALLPMTRRSGELLRSGVISRSARSPVGPAHQARTLWFAPMRSGPRSPRSLATATTSGLHLFLDLRTKLAERREPGWVGEFLRYHSRRAARRFWRRASVAVRQPLVRYASAAPHPGDAAGAERRVTILLFSAWGMGGTIRTTLNLAAYLADRYSVEIISVMRSREDPFFGEFPPGVKVTALDDKRPNAVRPGLTGAVRSALRRIPSVLVHPAERWAAWFSFWTDVKLVRKLRRRTGLLITTRPGLNLIAAELSPPGMVIIGGEHMHLRHHARPLREDMARIYSRLDAFTVLTEGSKRDYEELLDGVVPVAVIPNAIPALGGSTAALASRTILAAGRLVRQKGFDYLIPAFAQIAPAHPDWQLRIVGRGEQRERLQAMIDEYGLAEVATLAPPAKDMGAEFESASIFTLSSRFEGFPLTLLEAMSKGLAVVSFDCPTGPADVIDDHHNGLLIPPGDVDALATGLVEMVENEELRHRCGSAARETARRYRMEEIGPLWDNFLRELWRARGRSADGGRAESVILSSQESGSSRAKTASAAVR
jgi:glycosyltransferase involved in cell wall biosynthesis